MNLQRTQSLSGPGVLVIVASFLLGTVSGQEVLTDPADAINDYIEIGEFDQDGEFEDWRLNPRVSGEVANGLLEITTTGGDPFFSKAGILGTLPDMAMVEFRARVTASSGGWQHFWGDEMNPGFAGARHLDFPVLDDGEFHVYQINLGAVLTSRLTHARLDPGPDAGTQAEIDYIRVGKVSPDTDGDGLPDTVETDTGVFNGRRDTGTKPNVADTDGDGFNDGDEVALGADPTNAADFPVPSLDGYTKNRVIYVVSQEIEPNDPRVSGGTTTSFAIQPALPAGLAFDAANGRISGTPTAVSPATDYVVTATFTGGATDPFTINIEVRNPFIEYPLTDLNLTVGQGLSLLKPSIFGPAPISYEIEPELPLDLIFDAGTGEIFGTPIEPSPRTEYTVFASYDAFPDATTTLFVQVRGVPVLTIDPPDLVNDFVSAGEFNTAGEREGWQSNPGITLDVANGVLEVTTVGGDPHFFRNNVPDTAPELGLVEFRLRVLTFTPGAWELFWGEANAGGFSAARRFGHQPPTFDTEFHVMQFDLSTVITSPLTNVRLDPGGGPGTTLEVDYVRVGTISADTDMDGLPDTVETNTGFFIGPRDTGTDPNDADTDKDGFNDGQEVAFGTDPNDPAIVPVPSLDGYTRDRVVYIVNAEIEPNMPITRVETPTSFQITPGLPAGLLFSPTTGVISGTPTEVSPATEYTVTATFTGGATDDTLINIRVSNPFIQYPVVKNSLNLNAPITPLTPTIVGPAPTSFEIQPDLPPDLFFDTVTGEITGTPVQLSPLTEYTIFTTYDGFPDATTTLLISVLGNPIVTVDQPPLADFITLGEFDAIEDIDTWQRNGRVSDFVVENSLLKLDTTGNDPFFWTVFNDLLADCLIVEMRVRFSGDGGWQVFWTEDVEGRNNFGAPGQPLSVGMVNDEQFHVYRIDFTEAVEAPLRSFRLDPGGGAGTSVEVDWVRLGGCTNVVMPCEDFNVACNVVAGDPPSLRVELTRSPEPCLCTEVDLLIDGTLQDPLPREYPDDGIVNLELIDCAPGQHVLEVLCIHRGVQGLTASCNFVCGAALEICNNGIDDDGDQLVDCADDDCGADPVCRQQFVRGNIDAQGSINISDPIFLLSWLFQGGTEPPCLEAANVDGQGTINISDPIFLLSWLFQGGPPPPAPFQDCGRPDPDPGPDQVDCKEFALCP